MVIAVYYMVIAVCYIVIPDCYIVVVCGYYVLDIWSVAILTRIIYKIINKIEVE